MTEQQAWEQLYGRRSPDVRVLGRHAARGRRRGRAPSRRAARLAPRRDPESEAHAA